MLVTETVLVKVSPFTLAMRITESELLSARRRRSGSRRVNRIVGTSVSPDFVAGTPFVNVATNSVSVQSVTSTD